MRGRPRLQKRFARNFEQTHSVSRKLSECDASSHRFQNAGRPERSRTPSAIRFDLLNFVGRQVESRGANDALNLLHIARADDCARDCGVSQRPGDGNFAWRVTVTRTNGAAVQPAPGFWITSVPAILDSACANRQWEDLQRARVSSHQ